ncbi:MAG: hypothetical protein JWO19_212 [Bryobacterales bacterium]|nr:hypothetical protein [Bryobacterales bacterium]
MAALAASMCSQIRLVRTHSELIASDQKLDARIAQLISHLVNRMFEIGVAEEPTFAELALQTAAIEASGAGSMFRADTGRLLLDLTKKGIGPATRQNLHAMLQALYPEDRFGGMHELAWRLFLEAEYPEDGETSRSAQICRDLGEMKPERWKLWIRLLKLAPIRKATDAKSEQKIREALDRIGREDWESRVASWCALLQQPESSPLERQGQILLRLIDEVRRVAESPQPQPTSQLPNGTQEVLKLLREGRHAGFEQAVEYTKQRGYQLEIVEAVRQYHDTLHGSVTDQARRQHVGWWLWLEDVMPIKADDCWSSIVRADLRDFTGARKKAWMELIGNMTFAVVTNPPAKWVKIAQSALSKIDPEDFRNQIRRWTEPFKSDKPLRLSTPGRDVLRCLIWDCSLCPPDPELDEALASIGKAKWKNKESRDRLSKISGPLNDILSASHPEGVLTLDKPVPKTYDPQAAMDKALSEVLKSQPLGDRIEIHPDHIFVRGERDHYRIGMDGVITRRSGRHVRVNMDALPPYITQLVQPAIDAMDLAQGMFQPNQMRLFSLATILANDEQWESAID